MCKTSHFLGKEFYFQFFSFRFFFSGNEKRRKNSRFLKRKTTSLEKKEKGERKDFFAKQKIDLIKSDGIVV